MILDQTLLALKRIKERLQESIMVILGLGFGIAVVSVVLCILTDFNKMISSEADSEWRRNIYVFPKEFGETTNSVVTKIGNIDSPEIDFSLEYMESIKEFCPTIKYAYQRFWIELIKGSDEEFSENNSWWEGDMNAYGISEDFLPYLKMEINVGSNFTQEDYNNGNNVIILGGNLAKLLFNDDNPIGKSLYYNELEYKILGVLKEQYDNSSPKEIEKRKGNQWDQNNQIFLPYTTVATFREWDRMDSMIFGVEHGKDLAKGVREIKTFLKRDFTNNELGVESSLDWGTESEETFIQVLTVVGFIAVICLIIATLNNLNLMLARVLRQKKGLGISVALGSTKKDLFNGVFIESAILGLLGGFLGIILAIIFGYFLEKLLSSFDTFASVNMNITNLLISLGISLLLTAIFSIYPGIEATRTSTSLVLREE